ncbi:MAG: DUF2914 domain-containing protein [Thiogranum sp.]
MLHRLPWLLVAVAGLSMQALAEDAVLPDSAWRVVRAQFTTSIEDREPVDQVVVLSPPQVEVFFFTELANLEGRTVIHRWEHRGQVVSRVPFEVKGPRWRVYSKYILAPDQLGEWTVTVIDESDWPLYTELFRYEPAVTNGLQTPPDYGSSE